VGELSIRPATAADADAVGRIYAHYVQHSVATFDLEVPGPGFWPAKMADLVGAGLPFLVAELDGEIAGFAYVAPWRAKRAYRRTVEDTIYLAPGYEGRGLGTALLTALLDRAREAGSREVIAVVTDAGDASIRLHTALGFTEVGRLRAVGFKHDRWLDTVLLQVSLRD
jgi:L-amino acid N-acyltransferase YncA